MISPEKSAKLIRKYLDRHPSSVHIKKDPHPDLGIIVVIPAYREGNILFRTLDTLKTCYPPSVRVEVIIVLNASEDDGNDIISHQQQCRQEIRTYIQQGLPQWLSIFDLTVLNLRAKHFGAGLARKTGLDEAVRRFSILEKPEGIMVCLDADSPVAPNYFQSIEKWFAHPDHHGAIIRFEHPLEGDEYPQEVYEAIVFYELHLRYYLLGLRYSGFPYAYHTIGSCMAFRTLKYVQAGGMPRKQAGEDFYFLQKLIPLGGFGEINNTIVYPSPRPSDRVIFGTGASITQHITGTRKQGETYNPQAFYDLKKLFLHAGELHETSPDHFEDWTYQRLSGPLRSFLLNSGFREELTDIQHNCKFRNAFLKQFFHLFNAFRVIKYLAYVHEHFYSRSNVFDAAITMMEESSGVNAGDVLDEKDLLLKYREMERQLNYTGQF